METFALDKCLKLIESWQKKLLFREFRQHDVGKLNILLRNMLEIVTVPQFSLYHCVTTIILQDMKTKLSEF